MGSLSRGEWQHAEAATVWRSGFEAGDRPLAGYEFVFGQAGGGQSREFPATGHRDRCEPRLGLGRSDASIVEFGAKAASERQERPDCVNRNEPGEQGCTMPTSVPTSVPGRIAWLTRARAHADSGRKNAPAAISPSWCTAAGGTPERGRRRQRRRPARIAVPYSPASRSTIEHLGRRSRSVSPVQAGVGVTRLMTAGGAATSRIRPAFNPTVGGVTGTSPRYGNRSRRRTSRRSRR